MVIQRIGREAVLEQAVRDSLPEWYEEAIMRSGVSTVGDPKLDLTDLPAAGEPLSFSIEVGTTPRAKLGRYRDLEVGRREPEVPEEAVQAELDRLRESFARLDSVERPAEQGDHLVVDFVGRVDGEEFKGGQARDYMLELGGGRLIEGFEEQLVGARAGDARAVEVRLPGRVPGRGAAGPAGHVRRRGQGREAQGAARARRRLRLARRASSTRSTSCAPTSSTSSSTRRSTRSRTSSARRRSTRPPRRRT